MYRRLYVLICAIAMVILIIVTPILEAEVYPIRIVEVVTTDMAGVPKTTFKRGEFVVVSVTIEYPPEYYYMGPEIEFLLIVQVLTPELIVIALGFTLGSLSSGANVTTGYGFKIPLDAPLGTYSIKVYVWNGWPGVMGPQFKALAEPVTVTITVTD